MVRHQFPIANSNGAIAIMIPPEIVVSDVAVFSKGRYQALAWRRDRRSIGNGWPFTARQLHYGWCEINDVPLSMPQLSSRRNALGPMNRHLGRLKLLLLLSQFIPGENMSDLARANCLPQFRLRVIPMRHDVRLSQFVEWTIDQSHLLHPVVAFLPQHIPACVVTVLI